LKEKVEGVGTGGGEVEAEEEAIQESGWVVFKTAFV
jgi:hypothetical protein